MNFSREKKTDEKDTHTPILEKKKEITLNLKSELGQMVVQYKGSGPINWWRNRKHAIRTHFANLSLDPEKRLQGYEGT